jgi:ADP-heptose:LPS heptosyltransferase
MKIAPTQGFIGTSSGGHGTSVLEAVPHGGRVLVIRLRSLGDCVLTTPALHLLKRFRPDLHVGVVVEKRFHDIYTGNPDIDSILPPEARAVRQFAPDLCLNLHGGTRSATLTATCGARWRAGFAHFRHSYVYNVRIPTAQEILKLNRTVHTCEHVASAVIYLGVPMTDVPRARLYADPTPASQYAVIHPSASQPDKTWPADRFVAVAAHLKNHLDLEPVFIGSHADNLSPFDSFRTLRGAPLSAVKSLLRHAMLFIGNDSGPAHMAAAFGVPVVVLFGSSDPLIWGPWRTVSEILTHPDGISAVPVEAVTAAVGRLRVLV